MVYLAPLQSYTTSAYRRAFNDVIGGVDKYFTPFFEENQDGLYSPALQKATSCDEKMLVVPQVATNSPGFLTKFAKEMGNAGYKEINLNMGCPFPMLVKRHMGGGLLQFPELVEALFDGYFSSLSDVNLSVKMRLGVVDHNDWKTIVPILNKYPVSEVVVHPRIVAQKYDGEPNWDVFHKMVDVIDKPLIANGDLCSRDQIHHLQDRFNELKGVMIGRGMLTNPLMLLDKSVAFSEVLADFHRRYIDLIRSQVNDWHQVFGLVYYFWHYPLTVTTDGKRHLRKLKKVKSESAYVEWSSEGLMLWAKSLTFV